MRPYKMVRGLCPRDWMRWAVDVRRRAVGNVVKIGQAEQMRLTQPGGHANAGRRGRRPLRTTAKLSLQHTT